MRCHEAIRLMPLFLDSELSAEVTLEVEEHFESCAACRIRLEKERRLEDSVRAKLLEPRPEDRVVWDHGVTRAMRNAGAGKIPSKRAFVWSFAALFVAVLVTRMILFTHSELDLARSAAMDHARFVAEISEEELAPPTMANFLVAGSRALPPGTVLPRVVLEDYDVLKAGQCKLDGAPVAYLVLRKGDEPISLFVMSRTELQRFPDFAEKLGHQQDGVACQVADRAFFGTSAANIVACAVGRASAPELQKIVRWALAG